MTVQAIAPESSGRPGSDLVAGLVVGAIVLLGVLLVLSGVLIRRYRSECRQLRARNTQLSLENDRWHEDFAAQIGALTALRQETSGTRGGRFRPRVDVS